MERIVQPFADFAAQANVKKSEYEALYKESVENPEAFWSRMADRLTWFKKWDKVLEHDFANAKSKWFTGGKLNVSYNCLDRHLSSTLKNKAA
ncbi:MAG TPA: acetyl-coenzyme A synthetase N-terminal domain-containing protein, partial [Leptospiraceae bacterium]|nr:acetyl-coenzyme A synthetase N-terminal domain-containing protein [Leptospiraceae bacterium]